MIAKRRPVNTAKAILYAVVVHAIAGALLFFSFRFYENTKTPAAKKQEVVKAVVVDDARVKAEVEKIRKEEQRKRDEELERQRRLEEAKRKTLEAEKQRQAEEVRLAELKRRQDDERKQMEVERKKAAEAEKKRQEEERQRELERKRKEAEAALREQLEAEEKLHEQARAAKAANEVARYKGLIAQKVERNWVRPVTSLQNPSCVVRVRVVPGGEVLEARVVRSSGNPAFDRSVESAVFKASPLPLPADKELFEYFRELEFTFRPKA